MTVAALLFAATIVMWVRSHYVYDRIILGTVVASDLGVIRVGWGGPTLYVPYWSLAIAWVALFAIAARRAVLPRRRAARGRCPACGYDCRATPERCPECGTAMPGRWSEPA